jgi:hypothetical protein
MMDRMNQSPLALRPRETATALSISPRLLWQLTHDGHIPCLRVGSGKRRTVLYSIADLQAWLTRQADTAKGATMTTPVKRILAKLPDAKPAGKGWTARFPAHEDERASLSIGVGDDGCAPVHCHAGSSVNDGETPEMDDDQMSEMDAGETPVKTTRFHLDCGVPKVMFDEPLGAESSANVAQRFADAGYVESRWDGIGDFLNEFTMCVYRATESTPMTRPWLMALHITINRSSHFELWCKSVRDVRHLRLFASKFVDLLAKEVLHERPL